MNMIQALNSALDIKMTEDPNVLSFGEDAGYFGGVFRVTDHLQKKHGLTRSFDAPISECGIVAAAIGMGSYGLRPVVEIQFADYIYPAYDQIVSEAAKLRYRSAGQFTAPIVVRSPYGGGIFGGQTHSQSPESLFTHIAGLKVVIPSNPYDAKGLLIAAIEDNDPVIFFEPKRIYNGPFDGHYDRPVSPWAKFAESAVPEETSSRTSRMMMLNVSSSVCSCSASRHWISGSPAMSREASCWVKMANCSCGRRYSFDLFSRALSLAISAVRTPCLISKAAIRPRKLNTKRRPRKLAKTIFSIVSSAA
jgi:2-oxoisovalerate dehydrogenase E1 component beta subunit